MKNLTVLALFVVVGACATNGGGPPQGTLLSEFRVHCQPAIDCPDEFQQWWDNAVKATGAVPAVSYHDLSIYVHPDPHFPCSASAGYCYGFWTVNGGSHFLLLAAPFTSRRAIVQHEMLHAILGSGKHDARFAAAARLLGVPASDQYHIN